MSTAEAWTVGRLLTWTAEYLKKYGSTSPRLDAEVLLAEAKGCGRIELYTAFTEEPSEQVRASFKEMVRRRAEGTPVAYLVGRKEFYSLSFEVNPDVLIPRPETEHLVVEAIDRAKLLTGQSPGSSNAAENEARAQPTPDVGPVVSGAGQGRGAAIPNDLPRPNDDSAKAVSSEEEWTPRPKAVKSYKGLRVADVGTGSGCVAVALAKSLPGAIVFALEVSKPALEVAARNIAHHAVTDQVRLMQSDLLSAVSGETLDIIVSNPPYISQSEYDALPVSVRSYEPKGALVSGPTGTETIEQLMQQAHPRLRKGGWLLVELSPMIAARVAELVDRSHWSEPVISKDLAGHARILALAKS